MEGIGTPPVHSFQGTTPLEMERYTARPLRGMGLPPGVTLRLKHPWVPLGRSRILVVSRKASQVAGAEPSTASLHYVFFTLFQRGGAAGPLPATREASRLTASMRDRPSGSQGCFRRNGFPGGWPIPRSRRAVYLSISNGVVPWKEWTGGVPIPSTLLRVC